MSQVCKSVEAFGGQCSVSSARILAPLRLRPFVGRDDVGRAMVSRGCTGSSTQLFPLANDVFIALI